MKILVRFSWLALLLSPIVLAQNNSDNQSGHSALQALSADDIGKEKVRQDQACPYFGLSEDGKVLFYHPTGTSVIATNVGSMSIVGATDDPPTVTFTIFGGSDPKNPDASMGQLNITSQMQTKCQALKKVIGWSPK